MSGEFVAKCRIKISPKCFLWLFPGALPAHVALRVLKLNYFDLILKNLQPGAWSEGSSVLSTNLTLALNHVLMNQVVCLLLDVDDEDKCDFVKQLTALNTGILKDTNGEGTPAVSWL